MLCFFDGFAILFVFFGFLFTAFFEVEINAVENDGCSKDRSIKLAGSLHMAKINHDESSNGDYNVSNKYHVRHPFVKVNVKRNGCKIENLFFNLQPLFSYSINDCKFFEIALTDDAGTAKGDYKQRNCDYDDTVDDTW